ncbi:MAG: hypothetical protein HYS06_13365 [Methylocystis sp.]|nr:hypothetical protein [Methylocystis sp.]MBI3275941.1 hypothetical protein [Methylocystis sp.]
MMSVAQCAAFSGLASSELVLGVTPSARHNWLLSGYLLNLGRGPQAVRDMIVADLRGWLDLGARRRAADLLIVLRFFLSDHPEARCAAPRVAHGQDDLDAAVGEEEDGVVLLLSRRRPANGDAARRFETCDGGDRVRSARAKVEQGVCFSSRRLGVAQVDAHAGERRFGLLTNKDAS